jgi:hypothetical protein
MRCRPGIVPVRGGPGSAVHRYALHRYALHRIRDTWPKLTLKIPIVVRWRGSIPGETPL